MEEGHQLLSGLSILGEPSPPKKERVRGRAPIAEDFPSRKPPPSRARARESLRVAEDWAWSGSCRNATLRKPSLVKKSIRLPQVARISWSLLQGFYVPVSIYYSGAFRRLEPFAFRDSIYVYRIPKACVTFKNKGNIVSYLLWW